MGALTPLMQDNIVVLSILMDKQQHYNDQNGVQHRFQKPFIIEIDHSYLCLHLIDRIQFFQHIHHVQLCVLLLLMSRTLPYLMCLSNFQDDMRNLVKIHRR